MPRMRVDNTRSNRLSHEYKFGFYFDNRHGIKHSQNFITREGAVLSLILTLFKLNRHSHLANKQLRYRFVPTDLNTLLTNYLLRREIWS